MCIRDSCRGGAGSSGSRCSRGGRAATSRGWTASGLEQLGPGQRAARPGQRRCRHVSPGAAEAPPSLVPRRQGSDAAHVAGGGRGLHGHRDGGLGGGHLPGLQAL
eukprot:4930245-Alexandrium_andersonii.AAC.1